jgi:S-adenosylmethionine-diacylgycerolhomoserine-N-methlytransferase
MNAAMTDTAFEKMDAMYRYQRYFYDATRRFFLLGRDTLLERITIRRGGRVIEIGCGTGRNLRILARRNEHANFYGIDASSEMLLTARANIAKDGLKNVELRTALAQDFGRGIFGLDEKFDSAFFSYSISMIPPWREAIKNATSQVRPGGSLYLVDFYDQAELPRWFRSLLQGWLRQFHVRSWPELMPFLEEFAATNGAELTVEPLYRRYSFIAELRLPPSRTS